MHSWSEISPFESSWHGYDLKPKKVSEKDIYFLKTNLKDIEFIFENQLEIINELDIQKYEIREKVYRLINYSQSISIDLALNKNCSDLIISSRPDIKFCNKKLSELINKLDLERFYVLGNSNNSSNLSDYSACDAVNISNPDNFKKKIIYFKNNLINFSSSSQRNGWEYQQFMNDSRIQVDILPLVFNKDWKIKRPSFSLIRDLTKRLYE